MCDTLLDVSIDQRPLEQLNQEALLAIEQKESQLVFACANPHSLVVAQSDATFKASLAKADHLVADGVGITLMARLVGTPIGPRITGHDYFLAVMNALQRRGHGRVFFFGSSEHVLDLIANRFVTDFPALTMCGTYSPPFRIWNKEENRRMVQIINEARPDVLWVGMTAPRQEKWVQANRELLNVAVIGSIGAVFDFYGGTYPRAPQWVCHAGLEWAYRLIKEPTRMWKRNFVSAPKFIALVIQRHVFGFRRLSAP
jgi:N-acetylglucosaminyldiphosphoundecaprenol N-acetyl-beta-D-mannosaminyltransferase